MIKVLRIINRFNLGGPTYNATFLSAYLSEDFETALYGGAHEEHEGDSLFIPESYGLSPKILTDLNRSINFGNDRKALCHLRELIRAYKPDIVHTHASKAGAIGRYAAYKERVPVIVHTFHGHVFHSYFGAFKTGIYKAVERYLARKSDAIIAISEIQKNELVNTYRIAKSDKVRVIPLGFDLDRFHANKEEKRRNFREYHQLVDSEVAIGLIGRFAPIKNHAGFIDAVSMAARLTHEKIVVFLIGDGELRGEIEKQIEESTKGLANLRFILTSWIKEVHEILPGLDLVALSSFNEGTPVSLIEAQAAGVAVISTDVGGVRDVVKEGETGIILPPFEVGNYASVLLDLIENKEKREFMSQNGWNYVHQKFHYKRLCEDVENLYRELLNKKRKHEVE